MRRIFIGVILYFLTVVSFSQKVEIKIFKTFNASASEWQILDEKYFPVLSDSEYPVKDSVLFSLEANKRYFLKINISEVRMSDTFLYVLYLNNEAILRINSDTGLGDSLYPFFTGVKEDLSAKITGGSDADISQFPWQVYLEAGDFVCGGSIINENWVLTAAHCTKGDFNVSIPASKMDVIVGANNPRNPRQGKKYLVSEVIVNENYDLQTLENDIALLKLAEPIDYINAQPIKIVSENDVLSGATDPGVMSWVTGYGATSVNPSTFPTILQKVNLPIVSNAQASVVWPRIPQSVLMAGYLNGNKDACSGDSGGPLAVPVTGGYKLAGLVSWGSRNCNTYGAYTRLSLFESWIVGKTGIEITFRAPVPKGDSIICPGTTTSNYNVNPGDGITAYSWNLAPDDAGSIVSNNESAVVSWNPAFKGPASISLQVSRGNEQSVASHLIVNTADQTVIKREPEDKTTCAEQYTSLEVVAEGYNLKYTWYKNDTLYSSGPTGTVINSNALVSNSGNYFCIVEGSCGQALSRTANLTVFPVTRINYITPDSEVLFGKELALEVKSEGHDLTYQWYKDNDSINHAAAKDYIIEKANANNIGLYKVKVSGTCGTETSNNTYIFVKQKAVTDGNDVYIWPTFVNDKFTVATENETPYSLLMFDNYGRLIRQIRDCSYQTVVDISDLPGGLYIVSVINNKMRKSLKLIKR